MLLKSKYFNYLPTPKKLALNYLLFVIYFIGFCWLIPRVSIVKHCGIRRELLLGLFSVKILAGIAVGWISIHLYGPGNDYWDFHDYALEEYQILLHNPAKYFINLFTSDYPGGYSGLFSSNNSYWNDLKGNVVIKLVSVFNIFSRGDYYINSLFFNTIIFLAHIIFYKLMIRIFPGKFWLVIIGCFLLPSTLYFSSGIHKDGLVFLCLGILIYGFYDWIERETITIKRIVLLLFSFLLLFLLRNYLSLILLPALFAWRLAAQIKKPVLGIFISVYGIVALMIFTVGYIKPTLNPFHIIISRQSDFINLPDAVTQIELTPLQPSFYSFLMNAGESLNHAFLRPYLWELPVITLLPFSLELLAYQILFVLCILYGLNHIRQFNQSFLWFLVFFLFTILLVIGYIVPNLGTLVRYRSLYLPLLVTPLLCWIDWKKLTKGYIKL